MLDLRKVDIFALILYLVQPSLLMARCYQSSIYPERLTTLAMPRVTKMGRSSSIDSLTTREKSGNMGICPIFLDSKHDVAQSLT